MEIVPSFYEDLAQFTTERRAALAGDPRYVETVWPDYAVRTGFLQVGTEDGARRLNRVLTNDPGIGVARHADAGYEEAIETAREKRIKMPSAGG